ncbi:hypothetical protein PUR49_00935 [Streptomyces sp. BE147]|uniref:hypothetical protein n=1 Tax=Streptomyces sp. BE147 TaxID=3002524 RepID=UPI002E76C145|nr:hypothetical protein [Streptomyces sp. BE147]MEE1735122.1 hypothetical protein [Streptomyces sp. BE147]
MHQHIAGLLKIAMTYGTDPADLGYWPLLDPPPITDQAIAGMLVAVRADPRIERSVSLGGGIRSRQHARVDGRSGVLPVELPTANLVTKARGFPDERADILCAALRGCL